MAEVEEASWSGWRKFCRPKEVDGEPEFSRAQSSLPSERVVCSRPGPPQDTGLTASGLAAEILHPPGTGTACGKAQDWGAIFSPFVATGISKNVLN